MGKSFVVEPGATAFGLPLCSCSSQAAVRSSRGERALRRDVQLL